LFNKIQNHVSAIFITGVIHTHTHAHNVMKHTNLIITFRMWVYKSIQRVDFIQSVITSEKR